MALMEKPDFCSIAEYKQAFEERLKEGDLSDEELLNLYLRVHGHHEALRVPALVTKRVRRNIGSVGVFVTLLNEDLKPCTRSIPGVMDQRGGLEHRRPRLKHTGSIRGRHPPNKRWGVSQL